MLTASCADRGARACPAVLRLGAPDSDLNAQQAFSLHSRPGAPFTILLDFDGHVTTGSAWNSAARPRIVTPPFDKDGNTSNWSAGELLDIFAIWRGVAEDYSPWPTVDVTTEVCARQAGGRAPRLRARRACRPAARRTRGRASWRPAACAP